MSVHNSTTPPLLPDIDQQFSGVGHLLEAKKKQRRRARQEQLLLENKVSYFEKQQRHTSKSIEDQKRLLQRVMRIRQRQEQERQQKQTQEYLNQQQLNRLKLQSEFERRTHQQNMKQAAQRLNSRNHLIFRSTKDKLNQQMERKRQTRREQMKNKRERFSAIERQKSYGKERVNQYRMDQMSQALSNYRDMMHREDSLRQSIQQNIQHLTDREQQLMERLRKSHTQHERLQATIQNAYDVELNMLETLISKKPKSRAGRSNSSGVKERNIQPTSNTKRDFFFKSMPPHAKLLNVTLNTFTPRRDFNPEQIIPRRKAKSRVQQSIRHIEKQYKS